MAAVLKISSIRSAVSRLHSTNRQILTALSSDNAVFFGANQMTDAPLVSSGLTYKLDSPMPVCPQRQTGVRTKKHLLKGAFFNLGRTMGWSRKATAAPVAFRRQAQVCRRVNKFICATCPANQVTDAPLVSSGLTYKLDSPMPVCPQRQTGVRTKKHLLKGAFFNLGRTMGLEPTTTGTTNRGSTN